MAPPAQQPSQTNRVAKTPALQHDSPWPRLFTILRHNSPWALLFTFLYLALLIVPWAFTCLLNKGKFHLREPKENYGYHNLTFRAQPRDITFNTNLVHATDILGYIAAVAALPIIYDLLSRAAAAYSQRTSLNKPLSAKQLFSLADGRFIRPWGSPSPNGSWLYLLGSGLVVISIIHLPIRAITVQREIIHVPQGATPSETRNFKYETSNYEIVGNTRVITPDYLAGKLVGFDPTPAILATAPKDKVVARTRSSLKSLSPHNVLLKAWRDEGGEKNRAWGDEGGEKNRAFASSIPKDSITGLYRQLATRMNSTCNCELSDFPSQCDDGGLNYKSENLTIEFCVDGLFQKSPWKLEQYLREDITEEFYVRLRANESEIQTGVFRSGDAYRCTGTSSLGYFELGNRFNNGIHGPLVSAPYRTPEIAVQAGFHVDNNRRYNNRRTDFFDPISDLNSTIPGPLALSLLALFGPGSFSKLAQSIKTADDAVSRTLCRTVPLHFVNWKDDMDQFNGGIGQDGDIYPSVCSYANWVRDPVTGKVTDKIKRVIVAKWQDQYLWDLVSTLDRQNARFAVRPVYTPPDFGGEDANSFLSMAMYFANQALLDIASSSYIYPLDPRDGFVTPTAIWNIPGLEYNKPSVSTAGVVVVSVLLGLQVLGILFLLWYIYSIPTWTNTLDSLAIARIAYQLPDEDQDLLKEIGLRRARRSEVEKLGGVGEEANAMMLPATDNVKEAGVSESTV